MSKINVAMAIEINLFNTLIANSVMGADGNRVQQDFTESEYAEFTDFKFDFWKDVTSPNGTFKVASFYLSPSAVSDTDKTLVIINMMLQKFPNLVTPVGAWNMDGSQYGMSVVPAVYDIATGTITTPATVTGLPVYPVHPLALAAMPDDVTYDAQGVETSRTPATTYKQVNLMLGQADRDWGTYV